MNNILFLENVLLIVLSMLIPIGTALLTLRIPFLVNFLKRYVIARALTIVIAGLMAFFVWAFLVPLNIESVDLLFVYIDSNVWDYSALPAQASNCQFDAVTCAYIKPTPPVGEHDPDTPGSPIWTLLTTPVLATVVSCLMIWRGTNKAPGASRLLDPVSIG